MLGFLLGIWWGGITNSMGMNLTKPQEIVEGRGDWHVRVHGVTNSRTWLQSLSCVWLFVTTWTAAFQASLSITSSWSLLKLMSTWVSGAFQPSHPPSSPSLPVFNLAQHQGLFQWVSSSHQVAKLLEFLLQHHQSFQRIFRTDFL